MQQRGFIRVSSKRKNELPTCAGAHLSIITLRRTPKRLKWFLECNVKALANWNVHIIEGVDGAIHKNVFERSRIISNKILESWSSGAIGSALSHMKSWRKCIQIGQPMIIAEDDAILATNLKRNLGFSTSREKSRSFIPASRVEYGLTTTSRDSYWSWRH